jgi:hypothetical protein
MRKPGRPEVLNDRKKHEILAILSTGCGRATAAHYVSCDPKTIYNTALRDAHFAEKLAQIENSSEINHLSNLSKAGKDHRYWRASAWALERMFPQKYGTRSPDAVTPVQLAELVARIGRMIAREIPAPRLRKRVIEQFEKILKESRNKLAEK